jgi:type IV secretion system protein VirB9
LRTGEDAQEEIEGPTFKDDVMQVPGVHRKLVLRIGREVACVFNNGYDPEAPRPVTSTASPQVNRILKGATKLIVQASAGGSRRRRGERHRRRACPGFG